MNVLHAAELIRIKANSKLNLKVKSTLGQFFTPYPISLYMASLFDKIEGNVSLLDPGCGSGSLTAAFVDESLRRKKINSINIDAFDIDSVIQPFIDETLLLCGKKFEKHGVSINANFILDDFIFNKTKNLGLFASKGCYSHIIMNPPYKKIATKSEHREALKSIGIEAVNLYTGFVALSIQQLDRGGELVAIIPRSFCNGVYYQSFREIVLRETAIKQIHIFDSRSQAFADNKVLQENIIIHLIKGAKQQEVTITSSPAADFKFDKETQSITATDRTIRTVPFTAIVRSNDKRKFIYITANERDRAIIDRLSYFNSTLDDLGIQVSTGAVVDFRLKEDLRQDLENGAVPLLYPTHLNGEVNWPKDSKKPNAISVSNKSRNWLWKNSGNFVIVKRFSSKEEKRRIVAAHYDGSLPGELIGFDNKLNVFHDSKRGFAKDVALGLYVYLNSTLLDKYYRLFGGHTQVNATDLRAIYYPDLKLLKSIGKLVRSAKRTSYDGESHSPSVSSLSQKQIDEILEEQLVKMVGNNDNPLAVQEKIDQALEILALLGMPKEQQNERSALTLLSLIDLKPNGSWTDLKRPMMGVTPIMNWCEEFYGKQYAPNTRETFRRKTLHQFINGGLCLYNPDRPDRPVNSPKACYQITIELFDVLVKYGTDEWETALADWLEHKETLITQYAKEREMEMIPLTLDDGTEIKLSPGNHSQLIRDIVMEFGPRFVPGSEVVYVGDTGAKEDFFKPERLAELGVRVDRKGKLPDVVLYCSKKNWLLLIESVTSHGAVDSKRHSELSKLFAEAIPGLIYVTAFRDRKTMAKYLADISWETEVWTADAPTHMIHFNGDRFLGPYGD